MKSTETASPALRRALAGQRVLLTYREVAQLPLMEHLSASTIWHLINEGAFPHRRVSDRKLLVLYPDDVEMWLRATALTADQRAA